MTGLLTVLVPIVLSGQFVIDPYRFGSGSVPALPTTNLVVNLAADGDVYNTGTTQCTDGQSVETWVDAAGTAQNCTASGTNQPTWFADDGSGRSYIDFDGNDILRSSSNVMTSDAGTLYAVMATDDITAGQVLVAINNETSTNHYMRLGITTTPSNGTVFFQTDGTGAAATAKTSTAVSNGTVAIAHGNNNSADDDRSAYINNGSSGNDTTANDYDGILSPDSYSVGAGYQNASEGANFNGKVYHVLIYNEEHDASERADTIAYLEDKWGL